LFYSRPSCEIPLGNMATSGHSHHIFHFLPGQHDAIATENSNSRSGYLSPHSKHSVIITRLGILSPSPFLCPSSSPGFLTPSPTMRDQDAQASFTKSSATSLSPDGFFVTYFCFVFIFFYLFRFLYDPSDMSSVRSPQISYIYKIFFSLTTSARS